MSNGFGVAIATIAVVGVGALGVINSNTNEYEDPVKYKIVENDNSWETDTASDEPEYYEDTDYVEVMGTDDCTDDCSGHSAGWEWAERYEICDPDYDNGNSDSFNEGVNQWTAENCE